MEIKFKTDKYYNRYIYQGKKVAQSALKRKTKWGSVYYMGTVEFEGKIAGYVIYQIGRNGLDICMKGNQYSYYNRHGITVIDVDDEALSVLYEFESDKREREIKDLEGRIRRNHESINNSRGNIKRYRKEARKLKENKFTPETLKRRLIREGK